MCGLVVLAGAVPAHIEASAILGAGARGPHSHGWAFRDHQDGWTVLRYPGRLVYGTRPDRLGIQVRAESGLYIGHSRLATSGARAGDVPPISESQPYVASGKYLIAHNGTIPDEISGRKPGEVDSRMLLRGLETGVPPLKMLHRAGRPQALIWTVGSAVLALRIDGKDQEAHPLYLVQGKGWRAISSGLVSRGMLIPEGEVVYVA